MAYRPKRVRRTRRTTRYSAPKRRRTVRRTKRRASSKKTIVIQLVSAPGMGAAMSTGTLGKKASSPLLRARF